VKPELSLTEAIKAVATGHARTKSATTAPHAETSLTQVLQAVGSRKRKPPATRAGRKGIVIYVEPEVAAAFRRLASDLGTTVQALGATALDLAFDKFGEPRPGSSGQGFLEQGG